MEAGTDDTVLTTTFDLALKMEWPDGIAIRALRNRFSDRWHGREEELRGWSTEESDRYRTEGFFSSEDGVVAAGQGVGLVNEIEPAGEIVRRLVREVAVILHERPRSLVD